jgi:hypothetical protein
MSEIDLRSSRHARDATVVNNQSELNELINLIAVLQFNQFNLLVLRFAINST